jgi:uncharacterized protein YggT (Ycf19 family)
MEAVDLLIDLISLALILTGITEWFFLWLILFFSASVRNQSLHRSRRRMIALCSLPLIALFQAVMSYKFYDDSHSNWLVALSAAAIPAFALLYLRTFFLKRSGFTH